MYTVLKPLYVTFARKASQHSGIWSFINNVNAALHRIRGTKGVSSSEDYDVVIYPKGYIANINYMPH